MTSAALRLKPTRNYQEKIRFGQRTTSYEWAQLGSNQRPTSYEPAALTTELWAPVGPIVTYLPVVGKREIFVSMQEYGMLLQGEEMLYE